MRIRTFHELTKGWEASDVLLIHHAFGSSWDPRDLSSERFRRAYPAFADYVGLFACDRGRIAAGLMIRRLPFRTRHGVQIVAGVGHVATQPDQARRGLARSLLVEAHRREREHGTSFALLYTRRSIVAHSLYEEMGYRDLTEFPRATRLIPARTPALVRPWRWRPAKARDRSAIEQLHARSVDGRYGFTRTGGHWRWEPRDHFVLEEGRRLRGYAKLERQEGVYGCFEATAGPAKARRKLLKGLEHQASGHWLVLSENALREAAPVMGRTPYAVSESSHFVLMGASLRARMGAKELAHELGTDDPDFAIGDQDFF